jgi:hypothetical protein
MSKREIGKSGERQDLFSHPGTLREHRAKPRIFPRRGNHASVPNPLNADRLLVVALGVPAALPMSR